jgi:hypothetical protein
MYLETNLLHEISEIVGFFCCLPEFFHLLGMLRSIDWFRTSVSGLCIDPTFKDQAVQEEGLGK